MFVCTYTGWIIKQASKQSIRFTSPACHQMAASKLPIRKNLEICDFHKTIYGNSLAALPPDQWFQVRNIHVVISPKTCKYHPLESKEIQRGYCWCALPAPSRIKTWRRPEITVITNSIPRIKTVHAHVYTESSSQTQCLGFYAHKNYLSWCLRYSYLHTPHPSSLKIRKWNLYYKHEQNTQKYK